MQQIIFGLAWLAAVAAVASFLIYGVLYLERKWNEEDESFAGLNRNDPLAESHEDVADTLR